MNRQPIIMDPYLAESASVTTDCTVESAPTGVRLAEADSFPGRATKPDVLSTHKKYQPDRQDILWNTDWGIAEARLNPEMAQSHGLLLFKGRWVTSEEKGLLKKQRVSYIAVRQVAALLLLSAIWKFAVFITGVAYIKVPIDKALLYLLVWGVTGIWASAQIVAAIGLYRFRRWAYWTTILLVVLSIFAALQLGGEGLIYLLLWSIALYYLLRGTIRQFFQRAVSPP